MQVVVTNLLQGVYAFLFEGVPVSLALRGPLLLEVNLVASVRRAELDHPFDAHVHHVPQGFLRNYTVLVRACSVLWSGANLPLHVLCWESLILEVKNIHLGHVHFLLLVVWTYDDSEERNVVLLETLLEHGVCL